MIFAALVDALSDDGRIVRANGSDVMARCPLPGHGNDDLHPGLHVTDYDGKALVNCFGLHGRCYLDLLDHYSIKHSKSEPTDVGKELLDVYTYKNTEGTPLYRVKRLWDHDLNGKTFYQERPGPEGAIHNLDGVTRVPYMLPEMLDAIERGEPVVLVEGEKDVHRLIALGLAATTTAGGSGSWGKGDYAKHFKDATVVIVPDNGAMGYAIDAAKDLRRVAKVHVVTLPPEIGPKGDTTDFIDQHSVQEYRELLNEAPEYTPEMARIDPEATEVGGISAQAEITANDDAFTVEWMEEGLRIQISGFLYAGASVKGMVDVWLGTYGHIVQSRRVDLTSGSQRSAIVTEINRSEKRKDVWNHHIEFAFGRAVAFLHSPRQAIDAMTIPIDSLMKYDWMIEGFLPGGRGEEGASLLVADGEVGKTWLAIGAAISVASGKQVFGKLTAEVVGKVLYLDWEGSPKKFGRRMRRIMAGARILDGDMDGQLRYQRETAPFAYIVATVRAMIREYGVVLVVIDSFRGASKGTLKDDDTAEAFFNAVNSLGIPVLVIHHFNRSDEYYGSAFIRNFARFMWEIPHDAYLQRDHQAKTGTKILLLRCDKDNEGSMSGQTMGMKIQWDNPEVYMTPTTGKYAEIVAANPDQTPSLPVTVFDLLEGEGRWMAREAIFNSVYPNSLRVTEDRKRLTNALGRLAKKGEIQERGDKDGREYAARGVIDEPAPWE